MTDKVINELLKHKMSMELSCEESDGHFRGSHFMSVLLSKGNFHVRVAIDLWMVDAIEGRTIEDILLDNIHYFAEEIKEC